MSGKGRGRGILALKSYDPLPRPSKKLVDSHLKPVIAPMNKQNEEGLAANTKTDRPVNVVKPLLPHMNESLPNVDQQSLMKKTNGVNLLAKYNFTGNPACPGGFVELTIKQKDKLILIRKGHTETQNPLWWEVRNEKGECGFVPANYCLVLDEKPTALPWLENQRLEREKLRKEEEENGKKNSFFGKPETPTVKPYQSAYSENNMKKTGNEAAQNYYCDICDKQLNGPTPYSMHMNSKMHREEVEYLKSCQT